MTTTFIDFVPSAVIAPIYQVTLDGQIYALTVEWVLQPQRYYVRLATLDGETLLYTALVGSPIGIDIEAMSWANGKVTVQTATEHKFRIGQVLNLTVTGCVPVADMLTVADQPLPGMFSQNSGRWSGDRGLPIPAVGGNLPDQVMALQQVFPEGFQAGALREHAAHADDGDGLGGLG